MILQANGAQAVTAKCIAWNDKGGGVLVGPPICGEPIPQGHLMCPIDWAHVSQPIKRAIINEQKRLVAMHATKPSSEWQALIRIAVQQNLDSRCKADPGLARRAVEFAEAAKAAQAAAAAGLIVPNGERFGIPDPEKKKT